MRSSRAEFASYDGWYLLIGFGRHILDGTLMPSEDTDRVLAVTAAAVAMEIEDV